MDSYPVRYNIQQTQVTRQQHVKVTAIPLKNHLFINQNLVGLLINVVVIIILLLSRKSWGG